LFYANRRETHGLREEKHHLDGYARTVSWIGNIWPRREASPPHLY